MKYKARYIVMAVTMLSVFTASAQSVVNDRFAIKATADIGMGNALSTNCAVQGMSTKASSSDFGIDFGWTFWKQNFHSLEANVGLGYGRTTLTATLPDMEYNYSAPAEADMDMDPYIRYYELSDLHQKIRANRVTLPLYVNYRYQTSKIVSVHALLGFKLGFNVSSKVAKTKGCAFSYGRYPQYDDLVIDAPCMNEFGEAILTTDQTLRPRRNEVTFSFLTGLGAEIQVCESFAVDVSLRYEGAMNDMFKTVTSDVVSDWSTDENPLLQVKNFDAENAPVRYTVADGQTVTAFSNYLKRANMSRLSFGISFIYRF